MEIRDTGEYAHRRSVIKGAQEVFEASSMTKGVLAACEHAEQDARAKKKAMRYLETHCEGQHVRKVAELLSTVHMPVTYSASVEVGGESDEPESR